MQGKYATFGRRLMSTLLAFSLGHNILSANAYSHGSVPGLMKNTDDSYNIAGRVPLEAHIMSKCPDARDALQLLVIPVMQRVWEKVDFTLSYIGTPTANDGVSCKHGSSECMGNIIELCARELYPDPKINLGFVMCLSREYQAIPDRSLIADCALEHAISIEELNNCAASDDGAHGLDLLRSSIKRTSERCKGRSNNQCDNPPQW
ncbi:hypothetical protein PT974_00808 [Cladobotryum mycophilum]|uniref:Gamma interferon inducible lysosomal thiol reductase n=1 Tax=Cladobotryum mycophilum TaxID=491253 RepID=A0ABR0T1W5_9HYPO